MNNSNFCKTFCRRVVTNKEELDDGTYKTVDPYYTWMTCSKDCRDKKCNNCEGNEYYIDPNYTTSRTERDIPKEEETNSYDIRKAIRKMRNNKNSEIRISNFKPREVKSSYSCYGKSQLECNQDKNCDYCVSTKKIGKTCYKVNEKDYICDSKYVGECVPLYNKNGKLKRNTTKPFYNYDKFSNSIMKDQEIMGEGKGKYNVLEYPRKCEGKAKRIISREEYERALRNKYRRN